jgi:hypothetical protein
MRHLRTPQYSETANGLLWLPVQSCPYPGGEPGRRPPAVPDGLPAAVPDGLPAAVPDGLPAGGSGVLPGAELAGAGPVRGSLTWRPASRKLRPVIFLLYQSA